MASAFEDSVNQPLNLVLVGRTGNGKSSTGNSILGRKAFDATISSTSVTKECKTEQCKVKDDRVLNVIDTPGLFDTCVPKEDAGREIVKCINPERGIHAFLFVVSLRNRFTDEEAYSIFMLQLLFGPEIFNYMMIVFTGGDELDKSLEDHLEDCPRSLQGTINLCNSRKVLFNNHKSALANVKETQITELLDQVESIVLENKGRPYSYDLFLKAQEMPLQLYHVKDKLKSVTNECEETLKRVMNENEETLKRVRNENEKELKRVRDENEKELKKVRDENEKELKRVRDENDKELKRVMDENDKELKRVMDENDKELKKVMNETIEKMQEMLQGSKPKYERCAHIAQIVAQIIGSIAAPTAAVAQIIAAGVSAGSCTNM